MEAGNCGQGAGAFLASPADEVNSMSNSRYDLRGGFSLGGARLLYITESHFGTDWHSLPHSHTCTELFYCLRGIGEFDLEGRTQPVGSDDLIIVNPNVEHTESSISANPLEYIVLGVDGLDFRFGDGNESYAVLNYRDTRSEIVFFLRTLLKEAQNKPESWENVCQHLLEVLLTNVLRHTHFTMQVANAKRTNKECAVARRYIDEHYAESLSLSMLAEIAHVNKYYLVHAFNKEYGVSPINYLIGRRIRESRYLLENTDYSLSQISHVLGFSSPSYFSQSFRRLMGQSPMEYRKQYRAAQAAEQLNGTE